MKIKASPCLFNHKICLEAVSSGTEVDAINVGGQIPDIYRRLDRRDETQAEPVTNDQLISPSSPMLPLQLATLDSAFMALFTRPCEESHFLPVVDRERSWSRNRGFHGRSWRNCDVTFCILQTVRSSVTFLLDPRKSDQLIPSTETCREDIMSPPPLARRRQRKKGIQSGNRTFGIL